MLIEKLKGNQKESFDNHLYITPFPIISLTSSFFSISESDFLQNHSMAFSFGIDGVNHNPEGDIGLQIVEKKVWF